MSACWLVRLQTQRAELKRNETEVAAVAEASKRIFRLLRRKHRHTDTQRHRHRHTNTPTHTHTDPPSHPLWQLLLTASWAVYQQNEHEKQAA